jgi:hypothetical protein
LVPASARWSGSSPPLLASDAVGAAAGGALGRFTKHKLTSEILDSPPERATRPGAAW